MKHIAYIAKALIAAGTAFLAAVVTYNVDVSPFVLVGVVSLLAGLAVFLVPNGDKPE